MGDRELVSAAVLELNLGAQAVFPSSYRKLQELANHAKPERVRIVRPGGGNLVEAMRSEEAKLRAAASKKFLQSRARSIDVFVHGGEGGAADGTLRAVMVQAYK